jgi:hypothetical protein
MALALDTLLANVAAGHGALDLAIGEGLVAVDTGLRAMHLGYSKIADYSREELGLNGSTAVKKARLARKVPERPLVREALRNGEITPRKAEIIAPVAVGEDQMRWILRAKGETVRALRKAVNAKPDADEEDWQQLSATVSKQQRMTLDEGLRWGAIVIGARSRNVRASGGLGPGVPQRAPGPRGRRACGQRVLLLKSGSGMVRGAIGARVTAMGGPRCRRSG